MTPRTMSQKPHVKMENGHLSPSVRVSLSDILLENKTNQTVTMFINRESKSSSTTPKYS